MRRSPGPAEGTVLAPERARTVAESLASWRPFPDTNPGLERLAAMGYKLGILSNVDDDLFAPTARRLQVPFDYVITAQQAHFTALDGTVRVKKGNSNTWVAADYHIPLEKGDVVQTGSEGMAKVVFNDGTSYTVKQDSLIVIEENSANDQQQTNVAVAVSTGTVDLSTATYSQGSKSQVIVAGATASLAPESAAQVRNDPKADQHEILMTKGTGEVTKGNETVKLANWEKVSFQGEHAHLEKAREIGPPTPIAPANMAPLFSNGAPTKDVEFSWTPMTSGCRANSGSRPISSVTTPASTSSSVRSKNPRSNTSTLPSPASRKATRR